MIPFDVVYCQDDNCSAIGSLADSVTIATYENGGRFSGAASSSHRWNCDDGLNDVKIRPTVVNFLEELAADELALAKGNMHVTRNQHVAFRNPDFFPSYHHKIEHRESRPEAIPQKNDEDANANLKFAFSLRGRNNSISMHSRIEYWQHQLAKPFRSLSLFRANPSQPEDPKRAFGNNGWGSVASQSSILTSLDCSKVRKLVRNGKNEQNRTKLEDEESKADEVSWFPARPFDFSNSKSERVKRPEAPFRELAFPKSQQTSFVESTIWREDIPTDESSVEEDEESAVILDIDVD